MAEKTGFLDESPGQKSSTRLMSMIALLAGIAMGGVSMYSGTPSNLPEWLISLAFFGKVGAKAVEGFQGNKANEAHSTAPPPEGRV